MRARQSAVLLAVLAGIVVALLPNASANAAAYRYWGFYQLVDGKWTFAQKGPDKITPADGSVDGWRFAVGTEAVTRMPRAVPSFDDLCGDTKPVAGKKRIGEVIDYGRTADSADGKEPPKPVGKCAVVDEAATSADALAAIAQPRVANGLVCGIDGWPATGCGDEVKNVTAAANAPDDTVTLALPGDAKKADTAKKDDGSDWGTWVGIGVAVLAVLALAGVALRRRGAAA